MFAKTATMIALATAVLAASPAAVFAADLSPHVQVRFSDLDLATAAGQVSLMARVQQAAATVCGGNEVHRSLGEEQTYRACRAGTVADAMPQLHAIIAAAEHPEQYAMVARSNQSPAD
jgi:UrcA family protein